MNINQLKKIARRHKVRAHFSKKSGGCFALAMPRRKKHLYCTDPHFHRNKNLAVLDFFHELGHCELGHIFQSAFPPYLSRIAEEQAVKYSFRQMKKRGWTVSSKSKIRYLRYSKTIANWKQWIGFRYSPKTKGMSRISQ